MLSTRSCLLSLNEIFPIYEVTYESTIGKRKSLGAYEERLINDGGDLGFLWELDIKKS